MFLSHHTQVRSPHLISFITQVRERKTSDLRAAAAQLASTSARSHSNPTSPLPNLPELERLMTVVPKMADAHDATLAAACRKLTDETKRVLEAFDGADAAICDLSRELTTTLFDLKKTGLELLTTKNQVEYERACAGEAMAEAYVEKEKILALTAELDDLRAILTKHQAEFSRVPGRPSESMPASRSGTLDLLLERDMYRAQYDSVCDDLEKEKKVHKDDQSKIVDLETQLADVQRELEEVKLREQEWVLGEAFLELTHTDEGYNPGNKENNDDAAGGGLLASNSAHFRLVGLRAPNLALGSVAEEDADAMTVSPHLGNDHTVDPAPNTPISPLLSPSGDPPALAH